MVSSLDAIQSLLDMDQLGSEKWSGYGIKVWTIKPCYDWATVFQLAYSSALQSRIERHIIYINKFLFINIFWYFFNF
jgi:hypothetical protein